MTSSSDIRLLKNGDHATFSKIFQQYSRTLYLYAFSLVNDKDLASDTVQESFVKLWENRHRLNEESDLKFYLFRTARNHVLNHFRHAKVVLENQEILLEEYRQQESNQVDEQDYAHKVEVINQTIASLPENCRKIFVMSVLEGYSYLETAERLEISINTVKSHVKSGYKKIRLALNPEGLLLFLLLFYIYPYFSLTLLVF